MKLEDVLNEKTKIYCLPYLPDIFFYTQYNIYTVYTIIILSVFFIHVSYLLLIIIH